MPPSDPPLLPRSIARTVLLLPLKDLRAVEMTPSSWMEDARRAADLPAWARGTELFYETACLVAALQPPPRPVRLVEEAPPGTPPVALVFPRRAALPIAYSCKTFYNLSVETMVGFTLQSRQETHAWMLSRLRHGLADIVTLAYELLVEARPCLSTSRSPKREMDPTSLTYRRRRRRKKTSRS